VKLYIKPASHQVTFLKVSAYRAGLFHRFHGWSGASVVSLRPLFLFRRCIMEKCSAHSCGSRSVDHC